MILHTVRLAAPDDVEELVALCAEHASFERTSYDAAGKAAGLREALFGRNPRLMAWVVTVNGLTAGYATATQDFSTWQASSYLYMDCLFVRPAWRNAGLGGALLGILVQCARDRGLGELQWQTPAWNVDACRFYRRHGAVGIDKTRFCLTIGAVPLNP